MTFPDFPGCFAAADEWDGLPAAIQEAVEAHFHGEPEAMPAPTPLERLTELNISLPANLVQQIDAWAGAHHLTRSGFLAQAALKAMR